MTASDARLVAVLSLSAGFVATELQSYDQCIPVRLSFEGIESHLL